MLPALFIGLADPPGLRAVGRAFDRLLTSFCCWRPRRSIAGALYNFRFVGIADIYDFRDTLESPAIVNYSITIASSALLPSHSPALLLARRYWRAGAALLLLLLIYPITLSKLALFAPFWLVAMLLLSKVFDAKTAVIMSLLVPVLIGLILHVLFSIQSALYFSIVNFRMVAIPSNALDVYNDFFSRHDPTYFCQISILKRFMPCPYQEPLWTVMEKAYNLGNLNASLFATEGVASVGLLFAPVATLVCGLVIALGNRLSAGLPPRFILLSGAVLLPFCSTSRYRSS